MFDYKVISCKFKHCLIYLQKIFIPGDNDIGGELPDIRTESKEKRYTRHFENITGIVRFGFIDYVKVCVFLTCNRDKSRK